MPAISQNPAFNHEELKALYTLVGMLPSSAINKTLREKIGSLMLIGDSDAKIKQLKEAVFTDKPAANTLATQFLAEVVDNKIVITSAPCTVKFERRQGANPSEYFNSTHMSFNTPTLSTGSNKFTLTEYNPHVYRTTSISMTLQEALLFSAFVEYHSKLWRIGVNEHTTASNEKTAEEEGGLLNAGTIDVEEGPVED